MTTPLEQLADASGVDFPNLRKARELTRDGLASRREALGSLESDDDIAIVLMGSWGRAEVTSGSDDDFMLLIRGDERTEVRPARSDVEAILDRPPGSQGIFGEPVSSTTIIEHIGLEADSNKNLSRRMLLLLESAHATRQDIHDDVYAQLLDRYLDQSVKPQRPPRFLLNDVIRYWRTMCVDFAGKEREGPEKWGLRNAKLRTARKILFAGGLLPVLECESRTKDEMAEFLATQFRMPPVDRIAMSFIKHRAIDQGARALTAYDEFLAILDDEDKRDHLNKLTRETAKHSDVFDEAARLGKELEIGLLALLFETDDLPKLVREYGVF
jgi:hypothetical protein